MTVKRNGTSVAQEKLVDAVTGYVNSQPKWAGTDVHVSCDDTPGITAGSGDVTVAIESFAADGPPGRYAFQAAVLVNGTKEKVVPVHATVAPMRKVWVARKALPKGHAIGPQDVELETLAPGASGDFLSNEESPEGLELDRSVRAQEPIYRHCVAQPMCVERGDTLSVNAVRGTLEVMMKAKALSSGRRGDKIFCLNEQSKRRLMVTLTNAKEGTVDL
jgi:flagella basal body P-ring formation protein FlgA